MAKKNKFSFVLGALALASTFPASASFTGYYDVANWATTYVPDPNNGSVDTTNAPASVTLIGPSNLTIFSYVDFTIPVAGSQTISFDWEYESLDTASNDDPTFDPFGYLLNGLFKQLTIDGGPSTQLGSVSVQVSAGDTFGFEQQSLDGLDGPGITVISDFTAVPEPATLGLLGIGLAAFGARRRCKA